MPKDIDFSPLEEEMKKAERFLILLPEKPDLDAVASALALYLSLQKAEKNVLIGCPEKPQKGFERLYGVDRLGQQVGNRNLVISFDYQKEAIEKVSYHVEDGKFNLVVQPQQGNQPLDPQSVSYSYSGLDADVLFVVGAQKLSELGELYSENKEFFNQIEVVNINNQPNSQFADQNYLAQSASLAQIVIQLIKKLNLPVNGDLATNLFAAIEHSTNSFQKNISAEVFEDAAWCLKIGGQKRHLKGEGTRPKQEQQIKEYQVKQEVKQETEQQKEEVKQTPPPDWLKPKVYKSDEKVE